MLRFVAPLPADPCCSVLHRVISSPESCSVVVSDYAVLYNITSRRGEFCCVVFRYAMYLSRYVLYLPRITPCRAVLFSVTLCRPYVSSCRVISRYVCYVMLCRAVPHRVTLCSVPRRIMSRCLLCHAMPRSIAPSYYVALCSVARYAVSHRDTLSGVERAVLSRSIASRVASLLGGALGCFRTTP